MKLIALKNLKPLLIILLAVFSLSACKKDKTNPVVITPDAPQITSVQPKDPKLGDIVTITGTGFGTTITDVKVTIGTTNVTISTVTGTQIKFAVPATLTSGNLAVAIKGVTAVNKDPDGVTITVKPTPVAVPTFTGMAPASGKTGDVITLTGTGFSTRASDNKVFFTTTTGGTVVLAPVKEATATTLKVELPASAVTGGVLIEVNGTNAVPATGFNTTFTVTSTPVGTGVDYIKVVSGSLNFSKIASSGKDIGGMWFDKVKNVLYYSDFIYPGATGNTIYKVDPGSGATSALTKDARITNVRNIATDASGNVYILRYEENVITFSIYKISADGATVTQVIKSIEPAGVFCFFVNSNNELCLRPNLKVTSAGVKITTGPNLFGLAMDRGGFYQGNTSYLVQCPDNDNVASTAKFIKWNMADNTVADAGFTLKSMFGADDPETFNSTNKIAQLKVAVDGSENVYAITDHAYISGSLSRTWMIRKAKAGTTASTLLGTFLVKFPAIDLHDYSGTVEFVSDARGNLYIKANSKDIIRITQ